MWGARLGAAQAARASAPATTPACGRGGARPPAPTVRLGMGMGRRFFPAGISREPKGRQFHENSRELLFVGLSWILNVCGALSLWHPPTACPLLLSASCNFTSYTKCTGWHNFLPATLLQHWGKRHFGQARWYFGADFWGGCFDQRPTPPGRVPLRPADAGHLLGSYAVSRTW